MIEFDSHSVKPSSSSSVGTSEFGFIARYGASLVLPKAPPTSMRSNGIFISARAQITFCTFDEVLRPQTFSIRPSSRSSLQAEQHTIHPEGGQQVGLAHDDKAQPHEVHGHEHAQAVQQRPQQ